MCGIAFSPEFAAAPAGREGGVPTPPQFPAEALSSPLLERQVPISAEAVPPLLAGERRPATVVVADVSSSTDLLAQIGTEAWVEIMNRVLQLLEAEVYRFGGEVDQFRGDGLVAFFGASVAHEDDPERAVLSALRMQDVIKSYARQLAEEQGIDLRLRIGVNTGEVIVTSIGNSRQHREDTAMGEAVAVAARMESAAEPGTILVSENTYRLASSRFDWEPLGEITLKGINMPIAVYRPLAPRTETKPPHRLHTYGLLPPLIGREPEFQALERCIQELGSGRGGIVMVLGDKGIGKSYLVTEVRQHVLRDSVLLSEAHDRKPVLTSPTPDEVEGEVEASDSEAPPLSSLVWLQGRCRSYDQSLPYSMWLDLMRHWLSVPEGKPETETRARLYEEAKALWGNRLAEYYPYLATFLSLPLEEPYAERIKHLDAEGWRQQFYLTLQSWIEAMARRGPLVLAFADVHWADASSLHLLASCLPLCDQESLLWLLVFRPERTSAVWEFRHQVETKYPHRLTTLALPPLTEAQSGEMIDQLIGDNALPAATRALIISTAEGNPYYIEELIHALIEQGALVQDEQTGQWKATRAVRSLDLPNTLQSLLLARIDGLSAEERQVLQMAAVIGTLFWSKVLEALVTDTSATLPKPAPFAQRAVIGSFPEGTARYANSTSPPRLIQHLTALQRVQLIQERGRIPDWGMEYRFKSSLIRDVAYESILSPQRVRFHRQVAQFLELQFGPERVPVQYYGMLAYQYGQARERGKEFFYTRLAAQQAARIYANAEALELYTRALTQLDEMEKDSVDESRRYIIHTQRFEVLKERCDVLYLTGDIEAGRVDAEALLPLARQLADDPAWLIDALLQQANVTHWRNHEELGAGLAMAEEALELARQLGDRRREIQCLHTISIQRRFLNDPAWQETDEHALELARQSGDRHYQVHILTHLGAAYSWSDQPERGMEYLEAALPICRELDDRITEVHLLSQIRLQAERQGDYYRLLTEYQQKALYISREIGYRAGEGSALTWCGQTQGIYLGDYDGGLALLEQSRSMLKGVPNELSAILRIVQILAVQAKHQEAATAMEEARQIAERDVKGLVRAGLPIVSSILYNSLGDPEHLLLALETAANAGHLAAGNPLLTRQYEMAAACQSATAHLGLAACLVEESDRQAHREQALQMSQKALAIYESTGFVQIIECVSEEILFRHSQALAANECHAEASRFLQEAYDEMMRKHDLIPPDTPFRQTFLENIALHRQIRTARATLLELDYSVGSDT